MLTVTIDLSEGISGADIPEQAVKKMRTGSDTLSLPSPRAFFAFLNDFPPPPSRSLEQANKKNAGKPRFLVIDALLHSLASLAASSSAVPFYCYL